MYVFLCVHIRKKKVQTFLILRLDGADRMHVYNNTRLAIHHSVLGTLPIRYLRFSNVAFLILSSILL